MKKSQEALKKQRNGAKGEPRVKHATDAVNSSENKKLCEELAPINHLNGFTL